MNVSIYHAIFHQHQETVMKLGLETKHTTSGKKKEKNTTP
jgi:hypothetical protein